jgi:hypothetical protein
MATEANSAEEAREFDEIEENLLAMAAANRRRLSEISNRINVNHCGRLNGAKKLLEHQRKLHRALSSYLTTGEF